MAARGYGAGPRTRLPERPYDRAEWGVLALGGALAVTAIAALVLGLAPYSYYPTLDPVLAPGAVALAAVVAGALGGRPGPAAVSVTAAVAEGLAFTYGGAAAPALDGSTWLAEGEVLLLEGPSGEGKSTLLRALCGLVPHFHGGAFSGRVTVAGHDTLTARPARIARMAGMVFQDPEGQAVLGSVARDVAFGLESAGVPAERIPGRVREALALAGAAHLAERSIATLSGGERQRVASRPSWRPRRPCCSWTSPPRSWTTRPRRRSGGPCGRSPAAGSRSRSPSTGPTGRGPSPTACWRCAGAAWRRPAPTRPAPRRRHPHRPARCSPRSRTSTPATPAPRCSAARDWSSTPAG